MTGDEKTNNELQNSNDPSKSVTRPPKSVFSDDFDDPEKKRDQDELPEDEPLTPELVEEEAIRGDFMLRWAAIFLAILMAFGQLNDTKPLVLIRSGDQMRANGFLPSRGDQFSITLDGKSVTNVSWLFDHVVSLSWLAGGEKGLTLLKVLVAAISAFLLVRISIPGVSSWWTSICAVFAIVACSSDFVPLPELITILGTTLTMSLLARHRLGKVDGLIWKLPVLVAIWCNFDSRAWVGAGVIFAYAVGATMSTRLAARKLTLAAAAEQKSLMIPAVLSVLALLVNPFHINSLLAPMTTYSIEYPAMQAQRRLDTDAARIRFDGRVDSYSILNPDAIALFDHSQVAGLAVLLMAFVVLLLARSSRDLGFLGALLFVTGLSVLAAHELPAASIVAAVVAGVAAQDWYRRSFNMKYSTDNSELLFSRGGRAATVLALAMVGFCVVASRLPGAMPLGFGFDAETKITIDTFKEQIADLDPEARVLHTLIEQGDMLIWNGRKSFVDSRVIPFGRRGDLNSVFGKHGNVLDTMLLQRLDQPAEPPKSSDPKEKERLEAERLGKIAAARGTLDEFKITHIMSRLAPPGKADFGSVRNLSATGEWLPISIGPSAAIMERVTQNLSEQEFARKAINLPKKAFRESELPPTPLRQFATPPSFYEKYVYRQRRATTANKRMGTHYLELTVKEPQSLPQAQSALASLNLAVRHFNLSLAEAPDDAEVFQMLGQSYAMLGMMEQLLEGQMASERLKQVRYLQAITALRQATLIDPASKAGWLSLFQLYQTRNRLDLANEALTTWLKLEDENPQGSGDEYEETLTQMYLRKREFEDQITKSDEQIEATVKQQTAAIQEQAEAKKTAAVAGDTEAKKPEEAEAEEIMQLIVSAMTSNSAGRPRKALQTLQEKVAIVDANPLGRILMCQILLETGELEQAHQKLSLLSEGARKQPEALAGIEWQLYAAISQLGIADYASASDILTSQFNQLNKQSASPQLYSGVLYSLPLVADVNLALNEFIPVWPFRNGQITAETVRNANEGRAEMSLLLALLKLEEGELVDARKIMTRIITDFGETRSRTLATVYFSMMDENADSIIDQTRTKTWEEFEYPGEKLPTDTTNPAGTSTKPPASIAAPQ